MKKKEAKIRTFSALEVANICGVVNQTVINWVKKGHLKAFVTPGGQYRIYSEYLVDFLQQRKMKIPEALLPFVKGRKILIADIDKNFLQFLKEKIEQDCPDYNIFTSSNGFDAGVLIATQNPDYIIVSENMRDITIEKLKSLSRREDGKSGNYKIIYIKDKDTDNITEDFSKTVDLVLTKPIDFSKINSFINSPIPRIADSQ